jgi:hypothetical protein
MTRITTAKKLLIVAAMTGATLAGTAGMASAGSSNGGCALKMINTHTWQTSDDGTPTGGGMVTAMSVDNTNGNGTSDPARGMFGAVANSC